MICVQQLQALSPLILCALLAACRNPPWKINQAVELATLEWVAWFNHQRLLKPIGYIPPAQAEAN